VAELPGGATEQDVMRAAAMGIDMHEQPDVAPAVVRS
jgi:hypothetical protein